MGEPFVSLVGAGPGDPGLLTLKGARRISEADVVIYDRLASPELLSHAAHGTELIDVGKRPGQAGITQAEINRLIVEKACEGKRVVRLKGGDPFVFGRGGEEAAACADAGVRFEIVPGVTSAVAAPAYAGIPVTHRGVATSVTFVTGHEESGESSVDWEGLARLSGTLVLMMSVGSLADTAAALVSAGKSADTRVAAIEWGTLPRQRVISATLGTIADAAEREGLEAPAAVVVGEVAALRDDLAWIEGLPLWGKTVLVTRARAQASDQVRLLEDLGAQVEVFPLIAIEATDEPGRLTDALERMAGGGFSWVVFASANGVERAFEAMAGLGLDARTLAGVRVAAIGPATADALAERGIAPDLIPEKATSEGMLEAFQENAKGDTVLLIRAEEGRDVLPDGLGDRGFDVEQVAAYRTVATDEGDAAGELRRRITSGEIDAVTFASSSTVTNYASLIGADCLPRVIACIGPATAATAVDLGIEPTVVAGTHTVEGLINAVASVLSEDARS